MVFLQRDCPAWFGTTRKFASDRRTHLRIAVCAGNHHRDWRRWRSRGAHTFRTGRRPGLTFATWSKDSQALYAGCEGVPTAALTASSIDNAAGLAGGAVSTIAVPRTRCQRNAIAPREAAAIRSLRIFMGTLYPALRSGKRLFHTAEKRAHRGLKGHFFFDVRHM